MKTLYITDLDGTLLNSRDRLSLFTVKAINGLIDRGHCFSYATARSLPSASVVTAGLATDMPVAVYNGAFIRNPKTGTVLSAIGFAADEKNDVMRFLKGTGIFPLVYAFVDGLERVSWLAGSEDEGMLHYLRLRNGDRRLRSVPDISDLYDGEAFYFTCIGSRSELLPVYERFRCDARYTCTLQQELYREEYWCEIMPRKATKANAVRLLKEILQCDRVVTFGDAVNDIPMFAASDECYAVGNAVDELKGVATSIIKSNDEDGVAHWLEDHFSE
ncbi:MAG: HAD family hydrolase [Clostridia bacterium]|nr:HAD family hydrolase [Clostridia bacterium]